MPDIFTQGLTTNTRQATVVLPFDNEASVIIRHYSQALPLTDFTRFVLTGIGSSVIDSVSDFGSIRMGSLTGEIILNLSEFINLTGEFQTKLVGYSPDNPNGVVLWHPLIPRARVQINVIRV